jgi:glycosyltransferase involved in cell wall biosynthesis
LRRKKIGLIYNYDENWVGGAYYIENLVFALDKLEEKFKPEVFLFSSDEHFESFKIKTSYPYLSRYVANNKPYSLVERIINKGFRFLSKRNLIDRNKLKVDLLFPVFDPGNEATQKVNYLYWIPDFQEHYLPGFFSDAEVKRRLQIQIAISSQKRALLLLSSEAALKDYQSLFPNALTKNFIVPFAVSHPSYEMTDIESIKTEFGVRGKYFISSNQFWAHKNHFIILEAVNILKEKGIEICMLFTGKQIDWRNPDYFDELRNYVNDNKLSENILFLGLIDRSVQLQLMKNAEAVIQPSRFEGWSTVIEDAKAMNQLVIASNINVHIEQLNGNGILFNPDDSLELAGVLQRINKDKPEINRIDYSENVLQYARNFISILKN